MATAGDGVGRAMLEKMGWSAGTGLGAKRDGRVEPLLPKARQEKLGVGAERRRPFKDAWWETAFQDAYGGGGGGGGAAGATSDAQLLAACEGRRCRPHGSAKLARLEKHDRAGAAPASSPADRADTSSSESSGEEDESGRPGRQGLCGDGITDNYQPNRSADQVDTRAKRGRDSEKERVNAALAFCSADAPAASAEPTLTSGRSEKKRKKSERMERAPRDEADTASRTKRAGDTGRPPLPAPETVATSRAKSKKSLARVMEREKRLRASGLSEEEVCRALDKRAVQKALKRKLRDVSKKVGKADRAGRVEKKRKR